MKPLDPKNEAGKFYQTDLELEQRRMTKSRMQSRQGQRIFEGLGEKFVCPNCGATMRKSFGIRSTYFCPECLSSIEEGEMNLDNRACPNCGQLIEDNECLYCGYSLGRDFE